ncbi:MAG TPA: hypothetical protein VMD52_00570 [Patescibacteria group bacterium]|nr:hypothetical protein [Patescibacteria group bacterium]
MYTRPVFKKGTKGQALIIAYMAIAFFMVVSAALIAKSFTERGIALRNRLTAETFYMAEGAIENAIANFTSAIANYQISPSVASYNVTTTYTLFGSATVNTAITRAENNERIISEGGTIVYIREYDFVATAVHPQNNTIRATVHQRIARRLIPTFQHAVFYNDDLEILPGANMTLTGRIHSNQDIYIDAESGVTLTINTNYLYSAGDIFDQRKDSGLPLAGEVRISVQGSSPTQYQAMNNLDCDDPSWQTAAITRWNGTVKSAVHGITELTAPSVASIQPGGYYASNASVTVDNGALKKDGIPLIESRDYPPGTISSTTGTNFKNNREGQYITMTNIDLAKLANVSGAISPVTHQPYPNNLPSNGLLYATTSGGANEPGIRLVNGSQIVRTGGLTVVSNDPVYIQGDYNTVNEQPTSVICDALNLLSNAWSDPNSKSGLDSRVATQTTVNCAFIAGVDNTSSGHYNGGLENYPRLHEKWTGINLNIKGSFVELWHSAIATGDWVYGAPQYTAPNRNWAYNTSFNDPAKLPPFTPWAVEARRVAWW